MCNVLRLELWFLWKLAVLWRTELRSKALDHLWSTAFVQFIIYELMIDFVNDLRSRLERVSWASFEADRELWFIACNHLWWSVHGGLDFPVTVRNLITDLSIMLLGDSLTKNMNAVNALKTLQGCCSRKIINDAAVWCKVELRLPLWSDYVIPLPLQQFAKSKNVLFITEWHIVLFIFSL